MKLLVPGALALALLGCGGGSTSQPVAPPTPAPPPHLVDQFNFTVTPQIGNRNLVRFVWAGGRFADRFLIEVGSSPGASDVGVFTVPAERDSGGHAQRLSFDWTPAPLGTLFARIRGESAAGVGPTSAEIKIASVDPRDVIEALFLGRGPLESSDIGCRQDTMRGWPVGTNLHILVAPAVTERQLVGIQRTVDQLPSGTQGALRGTISRVAEVDPRPITDEITIAIRPLDEVTRRCGGYAACTIYSFPSSPILQSVRILTVDFADPDTMAHELGHGAFGLCHIHVPEGLKPGPIMGASGVRGNNPGPPELEPLTINALQAVYGAHLAAGATRREFEAAGLINHRSRTAAATEPSRGRGEGGVVIDHGGGEIEVIKPFCLPSRDHP